MLDLTGLDHVWCWVAPHPADPEPTEADHAVSRFGTGSPETGLHASVELRSTRSQTAERDWDSTVHDLDGRRPRKIGAMGVECLGRPSGPVHQCNIRITEPDTVRAWWSTRGELRIQGETAICSMATRGAPIAGGEETGLEGLGQDLLGFGARLLGRTPPKATRQRQDERTETEARLQDALDQGDVVDDEVGCFDGWLRARQHRTPVEGGFAESWRIDIDHDAARPGVSLGVLLVAACASLCHRKATMRLPGHLGSF